MNVGTGEWINGIEPQLCWLHFLQLELSQLMFLCFIFGISKMWAKEINISETVRSK